ncbi:zf-HC2 domain-containing protein [Streptomyces cinereoruber]|uniref:zf-HC2 domain-containing protein n=1 Tax=Streptomyces cinereoruber TaxID=67260 RepID=UPI00363F923C
MTEEGQVHPPGDLLRGYAVGETAPEHLPSIERHLDGCSRCRDRLVYQTDLPAAVASIWAGVSDAMDAVVSSPVERWLIRLHVPPHVARLVAAVPALRGSWLAASALAMLLAALASRWLAPAGASDVFVLLAPLLPMATVALCFNTRWEPAGEMALVAPLSTFRLVLLRTSVVLGTCGVLSMAAALTLPQFGLSALAWLIPSCALTALSLLLSRHLNPGTVCAVAGGGWVVVGAFARDASWLTSGPGQLALAGVCAALLLALVLVRSTFDTERKMVAS